MHDEIKNIADELRLLLAETDGLRGRIDSIVRRLETLAEPAENTPATQPPSRPADEEEAALSVTDDDLEDAGPANDGPAAPTASVQGAIRLSLNDRYLFLRELFGGDIAALNGALDTLAGLSSPDEVAAYAAGTLGLNPEEPVAASFIMVACRRFDTHPPLLG